MAALGAEAQRLLGFLASHVRKVDPKDPRTFISYKDVHDSLKLPVLGKFGSSLQRQGLEKRGQVHFPRCSGADLGRPRDLTSMLLPTSVSICWRKRSLPKALFWRVWARRASCVSALGASRNMAW